MTEWSIWILIDNNGGYVNEQFKRNWNEKIAIVTSRFNQNITDALLESALETLIQQGVSEDGDISQFQVPGAFEIPQLAQRLAMSQQYHGVVCLGAVIRGETPLFDYVCREAARGIPVCCDVNWSSC